MSNPPERTQEHLERDQALMDIEWLVQHWLKKKNPLFLWEAYGVARKHGLEVPEEFFEYLDKAATSLFAASDEKGDAATKVASAFGLLTAQKDGAGSLLSKWGRERDKEKAVIRILALGAAAVKTGKKINLTKIMEQVAEEFGATPATVRRWYDASSYRLK